MKALGIDIGTTTLSVVLVDGDSGELIARETLSHSSFMDDGCPVGKVQDPERILALVRECVESTVRAHGEPDCVGLTGQMHGMLYVDRAGDAVSPLYTWQDGRGGLPFADESSAVDLLRGAGCSAAAGYGLSTHLYLLRTGGVPKAAAKLTTISDYVGMKLTGRLAPVLSADMAASWGCFDLRSGWFRVEALESLGVDAGMLPETRRGYEVIGRTRGGAPVICSLGDNQASVIGSVRDINDTLLINIGTGSQVSMGTDRFIDCSGSVELRPCGAQGYILAGSGLCGGRAYAMLERFYREIAGSDAPRYDAMQRQAQAFIDECGPEAAWHVRTAFSGTRDDPAARGSISGIGVDNFRPGALTVGVIAGILEELREAFDAMRTLTGRSPALLVGSGNGLRQNRLMQSLAEERFCLKLRIPAHMEEAAFGAALAAMAATGRKASLSEAQELIRYQ